MILVKVCVMFWDMFWVCVIMLVIVVLNDLLGLVRIG